MVSLLLNQKKLVEFNELRQKFAAEHPEYAEISKPIDNIDDVFMPYKDIMSQFTEEEKVEYKLVPDTQSCDFKGFYIVRDPSDHYFIPELTDYEEDNHIYNYGVVDNASQIIDNCKLPEDSVVLMWPVFKKVTSSCFGWRWHKWGPYYGVQKHICEYICDEPDVELVFTFSVVTLKKKG